MAEKSTALVEHVWMPPESVPPKLANLFPNGVTVVFVEEDDGGMVFLAAIPASHEEGERLADLFEGGAKHGDFVGYFAVRDRLCGDFPYHVLSVLYQREIEILIAEEERQERGGVKAVLAKAARFLPRRVSNN